MSPDEGGQRVPEGDPKAAPGPYLYSDHGQDLHGDPIKLVEAAPGSGLGQALVDISAGLEKVTGRSEQWRVLPGASTCPVSSCSGWGALGPLGG